MCVKDIFSAGAPEDCGIGDRRMAYTSINTNQSGGGAERCLYGGGIQLRGGER